MHARFMQVALLGLLAWIGFVSAPAAATEAPKPVHQLRIYEVHSGNEQAFHTRFRDHALRIMARHGFNVLATWEARSEERTEFVYLLEWPDEATMKARWASFMADEEWAAIKKQTGQAHGRFVDGIQDRTLHLTDYSPGAPGR